MRKAIEKEIAEVFDAGLERHPAELQAVELIRKHDEYTYLHSLNVTRLSIMLGRRLELDEEMLQDLGWSALLHDIGKLHVPLNVLNKLKKFSPEELSVMQSHPVEGLAAFAQTHEVTINRLKRLAAAFEHHQRYDLKGYPSVRQKLDLHPFSRIIAVADSFDAMTTDRIYQRRMLPDVALKIMSQGFGSIFDPLVLQVFITCMGAYPVGSLVRLSDDRMAVVESYDEGSEMDRPRLRLLESKEEINLMDPQHLNLRILRSEFPEDHGVNSNEI